VRCLSAGVEPNAGIAAVRALSEELRAGVQR
jgi:hypothetical protein